MGINPLSASGIKPNIEQGNSIMPSNNATAGNSTFQYDNNNTFNNQLPVSNSGQFKFVAPGDRLSRLVDIFGEKRLKQMGVVECATCNSRTYVDGSNDPGVSFKSPSHVSPEASFGAVMSHEQEHVANEQANAKSNDAQVVSQSVRIFTSICPECGKAYASGGVTKTTVASKGGYEDKSKTYSGNLVDAKL